MLLKPVILAAAGLTAATRAFLLPPEISQSDVNAVDALPEAHSPDIVEALSVPQHINLNVSCPGCLKTASDEPSHLEFELSIRHTPSGDMFVVNGSPLFPKPHTLLAARVARDGAVRPAGKKLKGHSPRRHRKRVLGYQLSVHQRALNAEEGLALYDLTLQIFKVGDTFVDGIPSLHITLVQDTKTDALVIGSVTESAAQPVFADSQKDCSTFVCKLLATVKGNMDKLKGKPCHGKMRGGHHHKGHPKTMGGHRHHRSWAELLKNVIQHIVLPIAVGIVAGVSVSLIGMMAGTLVVTVWRTLFRRPSHRRHSHSRKHSHSHHKTPKAELAVAEVEEKSELMEHQDPPPSYDEEAVPTPPSYTDEATPKTDV